MSVSLGPVGGPAGHRERWEELGEESSQDRLGWNLTGAFIAECSWLWVCATRFYSAFPLPQSLTKDLGGNAKCSDFTEEICQRVKDLE